MSTPRSFETLLKSGDLEMGRAEAEAALKRDPKDRRALLALAKLAALEGEEQRAEALLHQAAGGTRDDEADAMLVRAALLMRKGDPKAAGAIYLKLAEDPPRAEALYGVGFLLAEAEENELARKALQKAVELEPGMGVYHFQLARVLFALGQLAEAFEHLQTSLKLNPAHIPSYVVFAIALQAGGELDAAEDILRQGLKAFPEDEYLLQTLSNVLAGKGDIAGAADVAEKLAKLQPNHPSAIGNLARFRMAQGRFGDALSLCQALAERGQATVQSRSVEAMIYEGMNPPDPEGAAAAWRAAMELDPNDWAPANNLGNLLMRTPELPDAAKQARAALEEAHRRDPERPEPRLNLALACVKLGDKAKAKELAAELVGRGPTLEASIRQQAEQLLKQLG
ncbi:tetratricopeptide repeat protein [Hyalangium gracile]|uniref:tetratricopeptide repeat protein n=1 Tax=Hyalangium gracile TaxID=394092 RepID=UPI001CCA89AD|nr:tetratricopeptide repeat protein [Hyalangium gracile]